MSKTFDPAALVAWASGVMAGRGVDGPKARVVAETLVEGDLLGHDTHGLFLLAPYLGKLAEGAVKGVGAPDVLNDRPAASLWDGGMILGPWLVTEAIGAASTKAREVGAKVVVRSAQSLVSTPRM